MVYKHNQTYEKGKFEIRRGTKSLTHYLKAQQTKRILVSQSAFNDKHVREVLCNRQMANIIISTNQRLKMRQFYCFA